MSVSFTPPTPPVVVPYMDLGGGLNTRLDQHALERNELAVSINLWPAYDKAVTKRPGSIFLVTANGAVPSGLACKSLLSCRFHGVTYLIYVDTSGNVYISQNVTVGSWHLLGTVAAAALFVTAAQMFDPSVTPLSQSVFLCDGLSTPQYFKGPADTLHTVNITAGHLPSKYNAPGAPITPQFVNTLNNNSHLFYSGDSSNTSAVYVSDPFYPQSFTSAAMQVTTDPTVGAYQPAIIGNNDGVQGGAITGMESLGSAMVIFKETAVYSMVQTTLLGEVPAWQVVEVTNATGCLGSRTIVRFESFISFLGIDGVYITDGTTLQQISADVDTYFDSSLTGFQATITSRSLAIAVRHGMRLLIFFSTGGVAFCNMGIWFDFTKTSRFGNPIAGQISGMAPGGMVALRGPTDDGNVAWGDALLCRVGEFGVGHADYGNPISTAFAGKADLFDDVFGPESIVSQKQAQDAYVLVELVNVTTATQVDFFGQIIVDLQLSLSRVIGQPITTALAGGLWGTGLWGVMLWGASTANNFNVVKIPLQNAARGHLLQVAVAEISTIPWVIIGYGVYVNQQKVGY